MPLNEKNANAADQIRHLRELIAALERRVPRIERTGEVQIARDAASLKMKALKRIAELEQPADGRSATESDTASAEESAKKASRPR